MNSSKTVWLTGATGFLGSVIADGLKQSGYEVVGTGSELSVCEEDRLEAFAEEIHPEVIINCAGVKREAATLGNKLHAYEVNAIGARNVALVANTVGALMVQISTDDVFAPNQIAPVNEFDVPTPTSPYGKSKYAGEVMVRDTTPDHLILRASWVYQNGKGRFDRLLKAAANGEKYQSRTDEFAAPASIALYMKYLLKMLEADARGTYHIAPTGKTSRFDFASQILRNAGYDPSQVLVATTNPEDAGDIVLESLMLEMAGAKLPTWEEDLSHYMQLCGLLKGQ